MLEEVDWLAPETLDSCRHWTGLRSEPFLEWRRARGEARQVGLKVFGSFKGESGAPDALAARRALLLFAEAERRPDAVLLIRDGDAQRDRHGLEQARDDKPWPFEVIIGLENPKRECWVLVGFEPKDQEEAKRVESVRKRLSFHPLRDAHKLTAREHGAKTDAKVALDELTEGRWERELECWEETPLGLLEERGIHTGLTAYLKEVRERLVPVVSGQSMSA